MGTTLLIWAVFMIRSLVELGSKAQGADAPRSGSREAIRAWDCRGDSEHRWSGNPQIGRREVL